MSRSAVSGPPPFVNESEPEAVITKLRWPFYEVNVRFGADHLLTFQAGWVCMGRRSAAAKARRELAKLKRPPAPTWTITL